MNDIDVLFMTSLKYLGFRARSEKEMREYLKKKLLRFQGLSELAIDEIINKLKIQKFLNDEDFAKMWVRSRTEFKPKGWRLIKMELKQKGISEEIIKSLEQKINSTEDEKRDELRLVKDILERKKRKYENLAKQERFNKAGSMLARRGFDLDTIKKAIEEVFGK